MGFPSLPPLHLPQLVDGAVCFYPEKSQRFPLRTWPSLYLRSSKDACLSGDRSVLTLVRLGGRDSWPVLVSAVTSQVYPRLRACVGCIDQDDHVAVLRGFGASQKTSSPDDYVRPSPVPIYREGLPSFHLVTDPKPLGSEGDRVEKKLVLVRLRSGSRVEYLRASRVHVDSIAAGPPRCHIVLNPHHAPAYCHELLERYV